jgi:hypothetical protein
VRDRDRDRDRERQRETERDRERQRRKDKEKQREWLLKFFPSHVHALVSQIGMVYHPESVGWLASGDAAGNTLLDSVALSSAPGFAGNLWQNGATIRIRNARSTAFFLRPRGLAVKMSAPLQFCARGIATYKGGSYLPATATLRLATLNCGFYALTSVSCGKSQMTSDGRCFTAHAWLSNITADLNITYMDVKFSSPLANASLAPCSNASLAMVADGRCVAWQRDPARLCYPAIVVNQTCFVYTNRKTSSAQQLVSVSDVTRPEFTYCPGSQIVQAPASSLLVAVNWTLPTATDDVAIAGGDDGVQRHRVRGCSLWLNLCTVSSMLQPTRLATGARATLASASRAAPGVRYCAAERCCRDAVRIRPWREQLAV